MSDLIRREDAKDAALTFIVEYCGAAFDEDMQKMLCKRLGALPSAESKTGKWVINAIFDDNIHAECSECRRHQIFYYGKQPTNYCPDCGARMSDEI